MIYSFPQPNHDELLYSLIGRYHSHSANLAYSQTTLDLFGDARVNRSVSMPSHLGALASNLSAFGYSFDQLLLEHTMFPYYTAFFQETTVGELRSWAISNSSAPIHTKLGLFQNLASQPKKLRFCPQCFSSELSSLGYGYWHRIHQTPGVFICPIHHCHLLESSVPYNSYGTNYYYAAEPSVLFPASFPSALSAGEKQQALWIANDSRYLYDHYSQIRRVFAKYQYSFRYIFLYLLREKSLATENNSLKIPELRSAFSSFFSSSLLDGVGLSVAEDIKRPWIVSLCRNDNPNCHPLPYILMFRFLCGGLESFLSYAESSNPEMFKTSPAVRRRPADFESKIERYRAQWLDACSKLPGASQNEIRKTADSVYQWLNRHDRAWLSVHPVERKARGGNKTYADWASKDQTYSRLVPCAVDLIKNLPGKPVRITINKLAQQIGLGSVHKRDYTLLPRTIAALQNSQESLSEYYLRKMLWAEDRLLSENQPLSKWLVLKKASIPTRYYDQTWHSFLSSKEHLEKELLMRG